MRMPTLRSLRGRQHGTGKQSVQAPARSAQGHSKNPAGDGFDGVVAIFPEVLASFRDGPAEFADHADCGVAQGCQRSCSGPDAASVLVQGHVADMMELVFDGPVATDKFKQPLGSSLVWGETGDQIDDFSRLFIA